MKHPKCPTCGKRHPFSRWGCTPPRTTVTEHTRSEWRRLAADAFRLNLDATALRFAAAANATEPMEPSRYDALQAEYREWLIAGFPGHPAETLRARGL